MDRALADPDLGPRLVVDATDPLVQYDEDIGLRYVGLFHSDRPDPTTFIGGLLDPYTGQVVTIIERPWVGGSDPWIIRD